MDEHQSFSTAEQRLMVRAMARKVPVSGSMELLPLCNLNCKMCYVRLSPEEMKRQGRLRTWEEWLEAGRQMQRAGVLFLLLTGGEPLLFPEFKKLYLELRKLGFVLTINTNGTLIDEQWADFFAQYKPRRINITLYGGDREDYGNLCGSPQGFDRVVSAVRLLRQRQVDVKLSTSVTPYNVHSLEKMFAIARELEVPLGVDTYMMPATRERTLPFDKQSRLGPEEAARARVEAMKLEWPEDFRDYALEKIREVEEFVPESTEPRPVTCYAGNCSFSVSWQGELHPCVILTKPTANIFDQGFQAAWEQVVSGVSEIRLHPDCSVCNLRTLCRTCAASGLLEGGSYDARPEYMCRYTQETLRLLREEVHG
jgi:radical SAM protein with 4Fe4S-binding SPASM domain